MKRIVLIGAGRLATNLGIALTKAGHHVEAVYSRTMTSAEMLAKRIGSVATDDVKGVPQDADIYIVSVKDSALRDVVSQLPTGRQEALFLHTAGSMGMDVWQGRVSRYGVFYPMQTFSKERVVDFQELPVFLEASDEATMSEMWQLAESISQHVYALTTAERKYLHLAAVFACNFANHCYALSADILAQHGLPFSVMLPLIDETARKVHTIAPSEAQTGPAVRWDENVIKMQGGLLQDNPMVQHLYEQMSESIHEQSLRATASKDGKI